MAARQTLDLGDLVPLPLLDECSACGVPVLLILVRGREIAVDPIEVLERFPCPTCAQVAAKGHVRDGICQRCLNTGMVGEPLPLGCVALAADGNGRLINGRKRAEGEAAHRPHRCEGDTTV